MDNTPPAVSKPHSSATWSYYFSPELVFRRLLWCHEYSWQSTGNRSLRRKSECSPISCRQLMWNWLQKPKSQKPWDQSATPWKPSVAREKWVIPDWLVSGRWILLLVENCCKEVYDGGFKTSLQFLWLLADHCGCLPVSECKHSPTAC